jgi:hypothetical protein
MKKVEKQIKYILTSGTEEITRTQTVQQICDFLGCSFPYIYANKHKNINKDGSWSFNFNSYNYTITTIINN